MNKRINDKINEIENFISEFDEIKSGSLENYLRDIKTKAACERYFEKIVEACVDLASLIIKERNLKLPEDDSEAFDILVEEGIITKDLAEKLKDAKGMRNIIAHQYGSVDDEIVFTAITEEIDKDVGELLEAVRKIK